MRQQSLAGLLLFPLLVGAAALASCKQEEVVEVEPPPRPIKIFRLDGDLGDTRPDYPGRIKAVKVVELAFEVDGHIIDWNVEEGQQVRKGQILSRLDPRDYQADAEAARARLRLAEAEIDARASSSPRGRAPNETSTSRHVRATSAVPSFAFPRKRSKTPSSARSSTASLRASS